MKTYESDDQAATLLLSNLTFEHAPAPLAIADSSTYKQQTQDKLTSSVP